MVYPSLFLLITTTSVVSIEGADLKSFFYSYMHGCISKSKKIILYFLASPVPISYQYVMCGGTVGGGHN